VNPLTTIRLAAEGIALVAIAFLWAEWRTTAAELASLKASETAYAAAHKIQLETASHAHDQELAQLRAAAVEPLPVVRLCRQAMHPGPAAPAAASAAAPGVQPVPAGDPRPGPDTGEDYAPVLRDLSVAADAVSGALREQQGVH
jgi:hypothetical protein